MINIDVKLIKVHQLKTEQKESGVRAMSEKMNKLMKLSTSLLVLVVVLIAFLMAGVRLFGLEIYAVLSGSMEPAYQTGSLIYVKDVSLEDLEVNDVITFRMGGNTTATHRIVEIVPDESNPERVRFRTKGDANEIVDATLVEYESVIGTPIFSVPYLGYLAVFMKKPPGLYITIAVSIALILLVTLLDLFTEDKKKEEVI